jgi:hypothetical protein
MYSSVTTSTLPKHGFTPSRGRLKDLSTVTDLYS